MDTDIIIILIEFIEIITFLVYCIFVCVQIVKRKKNVISVDYSMLNIGRIFIWGGMICSVLVSKNMSNGIYYLFFMTLFLAAYIFGSRLYLHSFKVKEENKKSRYYKFDKWAEKMYRKYLEKLWK